MGIDAPRIARELQAMGVKKLVVVYDDKEDLDLAAFPSDIEKNERANLIMFKKNCVISRASAVFCSNMRCGKTSPPQTWPASDPDKRIFVNTDVCEGCGDCGVQSTASHHAGGNRTGPQTRD